MDFRFSDEQLALRDAVHSFGEAHRGVDGPPPWDALVAASGIQRSLLLPG